MLFASYIFTLASLKWLCENLFSWNTCDQRDEKPLHRVVQKLRLRLVLLLMITVVFLYIKRPRTPMIDFFYTPFEAQGL